METRNLLTQLSNSIDFEKQQGSKRYQHVIPIRKPGNDIYIRVHKDESWRFSASLHKDSESGDYYFIHKDIVSKFNGNIAPVKIYATITRQSDFFLWPVRLEESLVAKNSWISSAHKIALQAESQWLKISSNQNTQSYDAYVAQGKIPDPIWPEEGFEQMVERAFKDRLVSTLDHPLIKQLNGEF